MGFSRRLSFSVVLLCSGWVVGRAIPNFDADHSGSELDRFSNRADTPEFVTMYDLFDHINPQPSKRVQINNNGSPKLRPIAAVIETMQTASPVVTSAVVLSQPPPTMSSPLAVTTAHAFTSPPYLFGGPGPVLLPSSVYKALTTSNSDMSLNNSNTTVAPSKHLTILVIIIGGILLFTLCVFVLMTPPDSFPGCARLKRATRKASKPSNEIANEPEKAMQDSSSWVAITSLSTFGKLPSEIVNGRETERPFRDTVIDVVAALSCSESNESPTSKFSMCSSEYPPSSTYSSELASNSSTVKAFPSTSRRLSGAVTAAKPIRPPRPPTTDSPALSDSVYLACSDTDQPYVIVAPQPLTEHDLLPNTFRPKSPRKLLTSTEFVSLHVRFTGGRLPPGMKRSSLDSRHSRTKSAPALGRPNKASSYLKVDIPPSKSIVSRKLDAMSMKNSDDKDDDEVLLEDIGGDSDVQESMVRRVMKHRRSRSASGWAYPFKGRRVRLPFKLEEE